MQSETPEQRVQRLAAKKAWREQNKDRLRAEYMTDKAKAQRKAWRAAHPEKVATYYVRYRQRRQEQVKDAAQRYVLSEQGRRAMEKYRRKVWSDPSLRILRIVKAAFVRAIRNDIEFDQCIQEILVQTPPMNCVCCGVTFNYGEEPSRTRQRTSPSIDRVDNEKGYVVGNVQIICWGCNEDKSHLTVEKLERFLNYIKTHAGKMPVTAGAL